MYSEISKLQEKSGINVTGSKSSKQDRLPHGDCCYGLSEEGQRNCHTWLKFFLEIQHVLFFSWVLLGFGLGFWGGSCMQMLDFLLRGLHWKLLLSVFFSGQLPMPTMLFQKAVHVDIIEVVGNSGAVSASATVIHTKARKCLVHMFFTCKIRINASLSLVLINYFEVPPICCQYTYLLLVIKMWTTWFSHVNSVLPGRIFNTTWI